MGLKLPQYQRVASKGIPVDVYLKSMVDVYDTRNLQFGGGYSEDSNMYAQAGGVVV